MRWPWQRPELSEPEVLERETPESSLQPQISAFWNALEGTAFSPTMTSLIWVAERCIQLNAQQIASMPLRFEGAFPNSVNPAWTSNPDPNWYPNGISDAVFAAVDSFYRWGDAFLYETAFYETGFASAWTVLDASAVGVELDTTTGRRKYEISGKPLDDNRVVQISRNPRGQLRGTSALRSYAEIVSAHNATMIAGAESIQNSPQVILKSSIRLDQEQAEALQDKWVERAASRRPGAPPVIPPELSLEGAAAKFSPKDLMLIEGQEFNARVLASAFGVPPFALNLPLTGGLTYQNPQMMRDHWWFSELHPSAKRMADAFTARMLPRGNAVWFDPSAWLAAAQATSAFQPDPATVNASPADQTNVAPLRPVQEVRS